MGSMYEKSKFSLNAKNQQLWELVTCPSRGFAAHPAPRAWAPATYGGAVRGDRADRSLQKCGGPLSASSLLPVQVARPPRSTQIFVNEDFSF